VLPAFRKLDDPAGGGFVGKVGSTGSRKATRAIFGAAQGVVCHCGKYFRDHP
jgi:hypothetical protein